jgi:hypothetical protein
MKKTFLVAVSLISCLAAYTQMLTGKVFDVTTQKPIPLVNVFFNSTTLGTCTDEDGNFILKIPQSEKLPVAFSSIGFNSLVLSDYSSDSPLKVYLTPKIYPLAEVTIQSKRSTRERTAREKRLGVFRKQFLGESLIARSCEILNENDLIFQYLDDEDILKAFSLKPLNINNEALGYQIIYYLDTFEYSSTRNSLSIYGNQIFREDTSLGSDNRIKAEKRRRSAYLGSRMHFFRSLWENNLDSAGFSVKNNSNSSLSRDRLVIKADSVTKYLKYNDVIYISYFTKNSSSSIKLLQDTVFFSKSGYFDPYGINWQGEMSRQRIGEMLPYDYQPGKKRE